MAETKKAVKENTAGKEKPRGDSKPPGSVRKPGEREIEKKGAKTGDDQLKDARAKRGRADKV